MRSDVVLAFRPESPGDRREYQVVRKIGQGGMGELFEVRCGPVHGAMKVLAKDLSSDAFVRERFTREAYLLAGIENRHIVRVLDYGELVPSGRPFFVMDLLRGSPLDAVLRKHSPLAPRLALQVMRAVLAALDCAHSLAPPIVHRDVKPANIFLHQPAHDECEVKLLDFGISSFVNKQTMMAGTHGYMAPEQLRAEPLTAQTDLYAAAVVLYEMLTGHGPFPRHEEMGIQSIQYATLEVPAPAITQFAPWVPPPVEQLIASALAKRPHDRPRDAQTFMHALDALGETELNRRWDPSTTLASLAASVASTDSSADDLSSLQEIGKRSDTVASYTSDSARERRTSHRVWWLAGGIVGLGAGASLAVVLLAPHPHPPPLRSALPPPPESELAPPPPTEASAPPLPVEEAVPVMSAARPIRSSSAPSRPTTSTTAKPIPSSSVAPAPSASTAPAGTAKAIRSL